MSDLHTWFTIINVGVLTVWLWFVMSDVHILRDRVRALEKALGESNERLAKENAKLREAFWELQG